MSRTVLHVHLPRGKLNTMNSSWDELRAERSTLNRRAHTAEPTPDRARKEPRGAVAPRGRGTSEYPVAHATCGLEVLAVTPAATRAGRGLLLLRDLGDERLGREEEPRHRRR